MNSKSAQMFYKSGACPSSQTLLAFYNDEILIPEMRGISSHLRKCEFCETELYFLTSFAGEEDNDEQTTEIPAALRELAEALLGGKQNEFRLLKQLLNPQEYLSLKSA